MRRHSWIAALALALTPGCFTLDFDDDGVIDRPPPSGYEVDYISCSNGRDDDQDGRIDCQDEDCLMRGHCGEQIPLSPDPGPEDRFDFCSDGVDNDGDGQFDCGDRGCQDIRELCCLAEFDDDTCSDGIDNDGNGFADCADFSCRNGVFVTVCDEETSCTDRIDNDGDRFTDCRDRDCVNDPACGESDCTDGDDNDEDGFTDCEDESCAMDESVCPGETDCENGVDDNGDGRVDCADYGCRDTSACMGSENTAALCSDGISNDDDDFVDCADFDCEAFCESEDTLEACMDGEDNDSNGFVDCNDFGCSRSTVPAIIAHCESVSESTLEACTDGIDNDGNGFVDCDDNNCRFAADVEIRGRCEATVETCTDRIDNNGNGFRDCADFSCQFVSFRLAGGACGGDGSCPAPGQACFRGACIVAVSPCQEGAEPGGNYTPVGDEIGFEPTLDERRRIATAGCTDGMDNDADGFTDCEDWDCNHATARTPSGETVPLVIDPNASCGPADAEGRRTCVMGPRAGQRCSTHGDCNALCRYAGGRTCLLGPNAGRSCGSDADCGGAEGSCSDPGPEGQPFVCP